MQIIGLSGMNGSGKDTVALMLAEKHGWLFADATTMLAAELTKRGLPTDRVHKSQLSAEWRREHGMAVIVDKAVEMFNAAPGKYKGLIVSSLRHPAEADRVHELHGTMLWVDADPRIRYDRIQAGNRGRVEDNKTFEEFLADEAREMHPEGDAATLNVAAVKERGDIFLENSGNDIQAFKAEAEELLRSLLV
jgi:dephospho-CoA kinase